MLMETRRFWRTEFVQPCSVNGLLKSRSIRRAHIEPSISISGQGCALWREIVSGVSVCVLCTFFFFGCQTTEPLKASTDFSHSKASTISKWNHTKVGTSDAYGDETLSTQEPRVESELKAKAVPMRVMLDKNRPPR